MTKLCLSAKKSDLFFWKGSVTFVIMKCFVRFICLIVLLAICGSARAAKPQIWLITCGPGAESYQLEGHTALRISLEGNDLVANWGVFDFNSPGFAYRFLKGETDYMVALEPYSEFVSHYRYTDRWVVAQKLNLTDQEALTLVSLVQENLLPANRVYRYNYVLDNCATRPLTLIERALQLNGDSLVIDMPQTDITFRRSFRQYHARYPVYQFFIDLALGSGIDRPITPREQAFAPVFLMDLAANCVIVSPDGTMRPLVSSVSEPVAVASVDSNHSEGAGSPVVYASILLAITLCFVVRDYKRRRVTRWWYALYFALFALGGTILTFLIFVSTHEATSPNINYFWLNPMLWIVPLTIWWRRTRPVTFWVLVANIVSVVGYFIALCVTPQVSNVAFYPLIAADLLLSLNFVYINCHYLPRR